MTRLAVLRAARNLALVPTSRPERDAPASWRPARPVRGGSRSPVSARLRARSRAASALGGRRGQRRAGDHDRDRRSDRLSLTKEMEMARAINQYRPTMRFLRGGSSGNVWRYRASLMRSSRAGAGARPNSSVRSLRGRRRSNRRPRSSSRRFWEWMPASGWVSSPTIGSIVLGRTRRRGRPRQPNGRNAFRLPSWVKRGAFERPESEADAVTKLLSFFRVASIDVWTARHAIRNVAYRHSPRFGSDEAALATWLQLGELQAELRIVRTTAKPNSRRRCSRFGA